MKKLLLLFLVSLLFLTGCQVRNYKYYKKVANTVILFYNDDSYDQKEFIDDDLPAINSFLSTLTHKDQIVDLSDFIIESPENMINEPNTEGVWEENGKCYIKYEDIKFINGELVDDHQHTDDLGWDDSHATHDPYLIEKNKMVVCNNHFTILYESDFYPDYGITKGDPRNNYLYLDGKELENKYEFYYRSVYDGSGMKVTINIKDKKIASISTEIVDVTEYIK